MHVLYFIVLMMCLSFGFVIKILWANTSTEQFVNCPKNNFIPKEKDFDFSFDTLPYQTKKIKLIGNNIVLQNNRVTFNDKTEFNNDVQIENNNLFDNDIDIDGTLQISALDETLTIDKNKMNKIKHNVKDVHTVFTPHYDIDDRDKIVLKELPDIGENKCVKGVFKMLRNNESFDVQNDLNNDDGICNTCCQNEKTIKPVEHLCKISMIKGPFKRDGNDDIELHTDMDNKVLESATSQNKDHPLYIEKVDNMQYIYLYKSRPDTMCELKLYRDDQKNKEIKSYPSKYFTTTGNVIKINPEEFSSKKHVKHIDGLRLLLQN